MIKSVIILAFGFCAQISQAQTNLDVLNEIRDFYGTPALGSALIHKSEIATIEVSGVRKLGNSTPVSVTDKFHIGSCTKSMTATLIATLVRDEIIGWETTLEDVFGEMELHPKYRNVTIEMLLSHWGGTPESISSINNGDLLNKLWDPELDYQAGRQLLVKTVLTVEPEREPNTKREYSNAGYVIVGAIIDRVTGKSWEENMEQRLFAPLNMDSCGFGAPGDPDAADPDQPWQHEMDDNGRIRSFKPDFYADNPASLGPAGNVHCNMIDWLKYAQLHIDGANGRETILLAPEEFAKLHTPYNDGRYTPGGWFMIGKTWAGGDLYTHDGSNTLSFAHISIAPEKDAAFVVVANYAHRSAKEAVLEMEEVLRQQVRAITP